MNIKYIPTGVCSYQINIDIDKNIINGLDVLGGCNGNLKGISNLLKGMSVDDAIAKLDGIKCGNKATSCPDQIAQALKQYKKEN